MRVAKWYKDALYRIYKSIGNFFNSLFGKSEPHLRGGMRLMGTKSVVL